MRTIALLCLVLCLGCSQPTAQESKPQPQTSEPEPASLQMSRLVKCPECDGKGQVVYDENHPIVKNGLGEPGTYTCPMCNGFGDLFVEEKP